MDSKKKIKEVYADGAGWNGKVSRFAVVGAGREEIISFPVPFTNNEMEYKAVLFALRLPTCHDSNIFTDSQLVYNQVHGEWKCNFQRLRYMRNEIRQLLSQKKCHLAWAPREENLAGKLLERR